MKEEQLEKEELRARFEEIERINAYYVIVQSGAFRYLLDFLKDYCVEGLVKMREAMDKNPGDEKTISALSGRWHEREELIDVIRGEVGNSLRTFQDWAKDNLSDEELEKFMITGGVDVRRISEYEPDRELFPDWGDTGTET